MARHVKKFSDQIRLAVDASDMSRYRICMEIGIAQSTFSRFMSGGWLGVQNMDALAELLGLNVTTRRKPAKGR
jgi:hypothetical protein